MRLLSGCCFVVVMFGPLQAQYDSLNSFPIRSTEFHAGLGTQKFLYGGVRQMIGQHFMIEADLGIQPVLNHAYYSGSLGISTTPPWKTYAGGHILFSMLFSTARDVFHARNSYQVLSGN